MADASASSKDTMYDTNDDNRWQAVKNGAKVKKSDFSPRPRPLPVVGINDPNLTEETRAELKALDARFARKAAKKAGVATPLAASGLAVTMQRSPKPGRYVKSPKPSAPSRPLHMLSLNDLKLTDEARARCTVQYAHVVRKAAQKAGIVTPSTASSLAATVPHSSHASPKDTSLWIPPHRRTLQPAVLQTIKDRPEDDGIEATARTLLGDDKALPSSDQVSPAREELSNIIQDKIMELRQPLLTEYGLNKLQGQVNNFAQLTDQRLVKLERGGAKEDLIKRLVEEAARQQIEALVLAGTKTWTKNKSELAEMKERYTKEANAQLEATQKQLMESQKALDKSKAHTEKFAIKCQDLQEHAKDNPSAHEKIDAFKEAVTKTTIPKIEDNFRKVFEEFNKLIGDVDTARDATNDFAESCEQTFEKMGAGLDWADEEITRLKSRAEEADKEIVQLNSRAEEADKEIAQLKSKAEEADKEIARLNSIAAFTDATVDALRQELASLRDTLSRGAVGASSNISPPRQSSFYDLEEDDALNRLSDRASSIDSIHTERLSSQDPLGLDVAHDFRLDEPSQLFDISEFDPDAGLVDRGHRGRSVRGRGRGGQPGGLARPNNHSVRRS